MRDESGWPEAKRLEDLWAGDFGYAYTDRNRWAGEERGPLWSSLLSEFPAQRVLEVGCNVGGNLRWIAGVVPSQNVFGIDINQKALAELRLRFPRIQVLRCAARHLPFLDGRFDLVFTMGVLMHQPESTLPVVMTEIVRCSRRYIFCGEYYASEPTEVPYRGQRNALIKRDFGSLYQELFPELQLRRRGFLSKAEGYDDVTYWVLEKGLGSPGRSPRTPHNDVVGSELPKGGFV